MTRWLSCRNRSPLTSPRSPGAPRKVIGAGFSGAVIAPIIAFALPGVGTTEAHLDPNRYGLRTVNAAGGSATHVAVRFTVRPVVVLFVDRRGRPLELWSNLGRRPSGGELAGLRVRLDSLRGPELDVHEAVRAAAAVPLARADWSVRGRAWHAAG